MKTKVIVVDAGHGGTDPGAVNLMGTPKDASDDVTEKVLTLSLALQVAAQLGSIGYEPVLTRKTDVSMSLPRRVQLAREAKAALFLSIHFNAAESPRAAGFEVYHDDTSARGRTWSERLVDQFRKDFPEGRVRGIRPDNQSQHSGLYVLEKTPMPAVLVEPAFMSNPEELIWVYRNMSKMAQTIAKATDSYWKAL